MPRSDDRWAEVDALFKSALDLPVDERRAFLERATSDEKIRARVLRLLDAEEAAGGFLSRPIGDLPGTSWETLLASPPLAARPETGGPSDRSGQRLGPYRLLRRVGRGGMATVYLAERADGLWEQRVAVKVLRRGLDTDDVIRRFHAERRILSALDHANIARLLDGGTTDDGLPFLVMEYVEGVPITRYCDDRALSLERRLELVCDVGRALQHAHQALVVHRDLKPSNILVDAEGRVKLLDFGIAKIVDPSTDGTRTRTELRRLTPAWASPEQLSGPTVTTVSDVFQLGLLLSHLVAGGRPYDTEGAESAATVARRLAEADPSPPSALVTDGAARLRGFRTAAALSRRLRGDLDTIVLRAAAVEPDRRYPSASGLVEDVERHLEGLPIRARPSTLGYRVRKAMTRRPWLGPAAVLVLVVAVGYVLTLARHSSQLQAERDLAMSEAERAAEVQQVLLEVFRSVDPWAPRATATPDATVRQVLDRGVEHIDRTLDGRPEIRADLLIALADIYGNLDLVDPARTLARDALELHRRQDGDVSPRVVHDLRVLGGLEARAGDVDPARALLTRGLSLAEEASAPDTTIAGILTELGRLEGGEGRTAEAERYLRRAIALLSARAPESSGRLARAKLELSQALLAESRVEESRRLAEEAVALSRLAHGRLHPATAVALQELADVHDWERRADAAIPMYREAIAILDEALGPGHVQTVHARNNLAVTLRQVGRLEEAETIQRRVVMELRRREAGNPDELAGALQNLGVTLQERGDLRGAEAAFREAMDLYDRTLGADHFRRALPRLSLTSVLLAREDAGSAERVARDAGAILERSLPEDHYVRAMGRCRLGRAVLARGRLPEALALIEESVRTLTTTAQPSPRYELECRTALAGAHRMAGRETLAAEQERHIDRLRAGAGGG